MSLASGMRLGPYELLTLAGEGGMGAVYRARDTRLDRTVAVKVLSAHLGDSPEARARFEREARLISSLSHPHICALYDVGREGDTDYLVMEFLEGETLAARLARGPLPLDLVLRFGGEIAGALDRAHRQGIVHRDLKPGNILVTSAGIKLLDFGLAKLQAMPARSQSLSAIAAQPTEGVAATPTIEGALLGTPQYMAPEQIEGRGADARADLWAFGCVLYEMATGRRAFAGPSAAALAAAILGGEPERPSIAAAALPMALERLILACLVKDPERRWQSALDAELELAGIAATGVAPPEARPTARRPRFIRRVVAVALLLVATGAAYWLGRRWVEPPPGPAVRFQVAPPPGASFIASSVENLSIAVAPEGDRVAFVAQDQEGQRVWLRRLDSLEAQPLPGTEGAYSVTWSPDGGSLAFFAAGKLRRIDLAGGSVVPICDVHPGMGYAASWGVGGQILFAAVQGDAIYRVAAAGGLPEKVVDSDTANKVYRVVWPQYLPDGRGFLYTARTADRSSSLMLVDGDRPPRIVAPLASRIELIAADWLLFVRDGALLAQRFDRAAGRLVGTAVAIAPTVRYFFSSAWAGFAASARGTVFYLPGRDRKRLAWIDRSGATTGSVGEPGEYLSVAIAPDGRSLLTARATPELGTYDLWQVDLERGVETRITSDPDADFDPVWLPDGRGLVYSSIRTRSPNLVRRDLATGSEQVLLPRPAFQSATDVSRDGRLLAYAERGDAGRFHAWTLRLDGPPNPTDLFGPETAESQMRFSPDARYFAYTSNASGDFEAYVAPLERRGDSVRLSQHGASILRWTRDGREILFLDRDRKLISVPVSTSPKLEVGSARTLFELPVGSAWSDFDLTPDGQRLLAVVTERSAGSEPAAVIVGWRPPGAY